jgi:hypothetical protein
MKLISDYKNKGYSFIINTNMVKPHWEIAKKHSYCRLCGKEILKGEERFVLEVDLDHPYLSTYYQVFVRFFFCKNHSIQEVEKELGCNIECYMYHSPSP